MKIKVSSKLILATLFALTLGPLEAWAAAPHCNTIFNDIVLDTREYSAFEQIFKIRELTPQVLKTSHTNEIAKALVYKLRQEEIRYDKVLRERPDQTTVDLYNDSEIMLFFKVKNVDYMASGGFLNQHMTGTSGGANNSKLRQTVEDWYSDMKLGNSPESLKLRAKSAYLNISTDKFLGARNTPPHYQFGSVAAVFKDHIKDQSIWTAYNSLEVGKSIGSSSTAKGTVASLINKCTQCVIGRDLIDPNISGKSLLPFKGTFKSQRMSIVDHQSYHEVLIYGEITFADVKHFIVTDPLEARRLARYGKPIYFAEVVNKHNRPYYKSKAMIFDGKEPADGYHGLFSR